jgi:hypothetical protein
VPYLDARSGKRRMIRSGVIGGTGYSQKLTGVITSSAKTCNVCHLIVSKRGRASGEENLLEGHWVLLKLLSSPDKIETRWAPETENIAIEKSLQGERKEDLSRLHRPSAFLFNIYSH